MDHDEPIEIEGTGSVHAAAGAAVAVNVLLLLTLVAVVFFVRSSDLGTIDRQIRVIEGDDPCVTLSQAAQSDAGKHRIGALTKDCVAFLDELGPLISHKLACDIFKAGGRPCPKLPITPQNGVSPQPGGSNSGPVRSPTPGGVALQPGPTGRQKPGPGRPGPQGQPAAPLPGPSPSLLPPQANGKGTPDPPPQAKGPVGSTVDAVTGTLCDVTHPVTGLCLR